MEMLNVMFRLLGLKNATRYNINHPKNILKKLIPVSSPGDFNQGMMELGALICSPKKQNLSFESYLQSFFIKKPRRLPIKERCKKIPTYQYLAGILKHNNKFLILKEKKNSMLGGLWELPNFRFEEAKSLEKFLRKK